MSALKRMKEWARGLCGYDERGNEVLDPTPISIPVGFERPETLAEIMARVLRSQEFERAAARNDVETFEEANDFELPDEEMFESPWEEGNEFGTVMTKELETRAGVVRITDEEVERARQVIADYDSRRAKGNGSGVGGAGASAPGSGKVESAGSQEGKGSAGGKGA